MLPSERHSASCWPEGASCAEPWLLVTMQRVRLNDSLLRGGAHAPHHPLPRKLGLEQPFRASGSLLILQSTVYRNLCETGLASDAPYSVRLSAPRAQFRPSLPRCMLQQAALTGPPPPLHTTSDLLRLLAADAHPFAAVAEAVAARFGGSAESQAWLARTLVTLLRVRGQRGCRRARTMPRHAANFGRRSTQRGSYGPPAAGALIACPFPAAPSTPGWPAVHRGREDECRLPAALFRPGDRGVTRGAAPPGVARRRRAPRCARLGRRAGAAAAGRGARQRQQPGQPGKPGQRGQQPCGLAQLAGAAGARSRGGGRRAAAPAHTAAGPGRDGRCAGRSIAAWPAAADCALAPAALAGLCQPVGGRRRAATGVV